MGSIFKMAADTSENFIEILVADSAAFLKNVPMQTIAKNVYTIKEVIGEIRSASVRERLAVLPYEVNFRVPSAESLHFVSEFAKKTGDFRSLSIVDLNVIALVYQLHKEKCGSENLRKAPTRQVEFVNKQQHEKIPGFYSKTIVKSETAKSENITEDDIKDITDLTNKCSFDEQNVDLKNQQNKENVENSCEGQIGIDGGNVRISAYNDDVEKYSGVDGTTEENQEIDNTLTNPNQNDDDQNIDDNQIIGNQNIDDDQVIDGNLNIDDDNQVINDEDNIDDVISSDDDDDWITPSNISQVKADLGMVETEIKPVNVVVGCLTTDFAMQNVLIQMGLHVISVDGMLINEARSYVLKCHSCFKVTTQMQKLFCPNCGNQTLLKVSVSVDKDGVTQYHVPKRKKPFNIRGKRYPLPKPTGGRLSNIPLLCEDQQQSQKHLPKSQDKVNVLDQDYIVRSSPFHVNDTTSRAFHLGFHIHGKNRRNPNESQKKSRRKKK